MKWRMVVTTGQGDKADIRQIVGRDWVSGRISATSIGALKGASKPRGLMPKGL